MRPRRHAPQWRHSIGSRDPFGSGLRSRCPGPGADGRPWPLIPLRTPHSARLCAALRVGCALASDSLDPGAHRPHLWKHTNTSLVLPRSSDPCLNVSTMNWLTSATGARHATRCSRCWWDAHQPACTEHCIGTRRWSPWRPQWDGSRPWMAADGRSGHPTQPYPARESGRGEGVTGGADDRERASGGADVGCAGGVRHVL